MNLIEGARTLYLLTFLKASDLSAGVSERLSETLYAELLSDTTEETRRL